MDQNTPPKSQESALAPLKGAARVEAYLKDLADVPGVYRMVNGKGEVLYVGKARSLKKRVAAYAKPAALPYRIARMVSETAEMIFISTASETEALLLELRMQYPDDGPSKTLLSRIAHFREHPPPSDWDGVHIAKEK